MRMKHILFVTVLIVLTAVVYLFYFAAPGEFPQKDVLIAEINEYTKANAHKVQDIVKIDARHAFVPYNTEDGFYGFSLWVWDKYRWKVARVSTWGRPEVWKIKGNDPGTYHIVWNLSPKEAFKELKLYLLSDRSGYRSEGTAVYMPKVQMEETLPFAGNTYQAIPLPDEWVRFLDSSAGVEAKKRPQTFFTDLSRDQYVYYGWRAVGAEGESKHPEHTMNSSGVSKTSGRIRTDFMLYINGKDLEFTQKYHNGREAAPDSLLQQPAYHLAPYRAEPWFLFYETSESIGFQISDGIYLFNYNEDRMEAAFALSEEAFEPKFAAVAIMSADEKRIIINGSDPSSGEASKYFYQYDLASGKIYRIEGAAREVASFFPHPAEGRANEAFKAETWLPEDIRYYPEDSDTAYIPFKKADLPIVTYELQGTDPNTPSAPYLALTTDGRFVFMYSSHNGCLNFGSYEITGTQYKMVTKDGKNTFIFHKKGEKLVFDQENSATCILDEGTELADGAEFYVK